MLPLWRLTTARRKIYEMFGNTRFSRPAYGRIQDVLDRYLKSPGFFVEAGAVDGFFESNTYYLERFCGWKGILIEPVPEMFRRICVNRNKATAVNCALVSNDYSDATVPITSAHAMSRINRTNSTGNLRTLQVPARTLTSVLDAINPPQVNLLSLDVEGFELEVLKGLDFERWKPELIIIECLTLESRCKIDEILSCNYELVEEATFRDVVYRAR